MVEKTHTKNVENGSQCRIFPLDFLPVKIHYLTLNIPATGRPWALISQTISRG